MPDPGWLWKEVRDMHKVLKAPPCCWWSGHLRTLGHSEGQSFADIWSVQRNSAEALAAVLSRCGLQREQSSPSAHLGAIHISMQAAIFAGCRAVDHGQLLMEAAGSDRAAIRVLCSAFRSCSVLEAASRTGRAILKDNCNAVPPARQRSGQFQQLL